MMKNEIVIQKLEKADEILSKVMSLYVKDAEWNKREINKGLVRIKSIVTDVAVLLESENEKQR